MDNCKIIRTHQLSIHSEHSGVFFFFILIFLSLLKIYLRFYLHSFTIIIVLCIVKSCVVVLALIFHDLVSKLFFPRFMRRRYVLSITLFNQKYAIEFSYHIFLYYYLFSITATIY